MTTYQYALSHSERGCLAYIRRGLIGILHGYEEDNQTQQWVDLLTLKLLYSLVFFIVVEWIYVWFADNTLSAMPEPLIRSEQFVLSSLIHYPQYLLWGIEGGLVAVLFLNLLMCGWVGLARHLYRRMTKSDSVKEEVPNV